MLYSELASIARPYAKAAFEFAFKKNKINHWHNMLLFFSNVIINKDAQVVLNGLIYSEDLIRWFYSICNGKLDQFGKNFIKLIIINNRLKFLPEILKQFIKFRQSHEQILEIEVVSTYKLTKKQYQSISLAMENRFSRKIKLINKIDKSIVAGIMIYAGDILIDCSVKNRIKKLASKLNYSIGIKHET